MISYIIVAVVAVVAWHYRETLWDMVVALYEDDKPGK
jgi:hypothetical protein